MLSYTSFIDLSVLKFEIEYIQNKCEYSSEPNYHDGEFSFVSFQYVIGLMVVAFVYCLLFAGYYLLPVDSDNRKYVPGIVITYRYL